MKMKTKTTLKLHLTQERMVKTNQMTAFAKKDAGIGEHICILVGVQTAIAPVKINVAFPPKAEIDLSLLSFLYIFS